MRASVEGDAPREPDPVGAGENTEPVQPQVTQNSMASPRLIPAPESPRNGDDQETPLPPNITDDPSASFDSKCVPSQAPILEGSQYDHLTYDELHNLCKSRGYCKKDAKTALKTRLEAMDTVAKNSSQLQPDNMDTSFRF